jgi:hypothetical protein
MLAGYLSQPIFSPIETWVVVPVLWIPEAMRGVKECKEIIRVPGKTVGCTLTNLDIN